MSDPLKFPDQIKPPTVRTGAPIPLVAPAPLRRDRDQQPMLDLPDAIKARLREGAAEDALGPVEMGLPAGTSMAQRLREKLQLARNMVPADMPAAAGRVAAAAKDRVAAARPAWLSLDKISVPQISPELRDGIVKHGRRAGMNIGATIDKIIREVPSKAPLALPPPTTGTDLVTTDISTIAVHHGVKRPSIFAPGHIMTAVLAGGIIHIATTFAITSLGSGSAFRQLRPALPANEMVVLPAQMPGTQLLPFLAPDMLYAICRYDLTGGAIEVTALLPEAGWSLALYTRQGDNYYASPGQSVRPIPVRFVLSPASDRLVNLTPGVRKSDVDISQVTSPDAEGLVVVRAPLKGVAFEAAARAELKRAACAPSRR